MAGTRVRTDGTDPDHWIWSRRSFLSVAGWGAVLSSLAVGTTAWGRMMYPRVLFEDPTAFKVGFPSEYAPESVSDRWIKAYRFWLVRSGDRFLAISAICTHLGCNYFFDDTEKVFRCPCHTGYFDIKTGNVLGGPPPRALDVLEVKVSDDGVLQARYEDYRLGVPEKTQV